MTWPPGTTTPASLEMSISSASVCRRGNCHFQMSTRAHARRSCRALAFPLINFLLVYCNAYYLDVFGSHPQCLFTRLHSDHGVVCWKPHDCVRWFRYDCAPDANTVDVRFPGPSRDHENVRKNECTWKCTFSCRYFSLTERVMTGVQDFHCNSANTSFRWLWK